ncbi:hypothetical protein PC9H_000299 [Pleurotus ostreatus]|uniref:Uncharacterized protein n=1 Tax=Pleurotus ostreatus TaxID=5322 RepID=A0A8H7A3H0_PLEOS|nr:uncharacterized protein PC9H_000299 [Pleurotus ostreatus]KAF7439962.1 hypothetical protein PC9H_000299 [Pleurotus ostreatus]
MSNFDVPPPDYTSVADEPITAIEDSTTAANTTTIRFNTIHTADTGPVVLSWNPAQSYVEPSAFLTRTTFREIYFSIKYVEARAPTEPVVYTSSPFGHNCMILVPPPESHDTRPQYHITVDADCLNPLVHVTTVKRGANEYGDLVAEFELCYESPWKTTLYATFRPVRRPEVRTHPVIQAQLELN